MEQNLYFPSWNWGLAKQYLKTERARNWNQFSLLCTDLNPASKKQQELEEKQNKLYLHSIQNYTICHFGARNQSYTSNSSPCPSCDIAHLFSSCPTCSLRDEEARNGHWRAKGLHPTAELLWPAVPAVTRWPLSRTASHAASTALWRPSALSTFQTKIHKLAQHWKSLIINILTRNFFFITYYHC